MTTKSKMSPSKQLLSLAIFIISTFTFATTYYVDNEIGNSSHNGTSESTPWDSLQTVCTRSSTFQSGDIIKFKRGQRFYNFFNGALACSGNSTASITFQSYGNGTSPVLSTGKRIDQQSAWTDLADGRYLYTGYTGSVAMYVWEDDFPMKEASSSALTDGCWYLLPGTGIYVKPTDGQVYSSHEYYLSNNYVIFHIANRSYLKFMDIDFEYSKYGIYTGAYPTSATCGIDITNCSFSKMYAGVMKSKDEEFLTF